MNQNDRDNLAEWLNWERREHDYDVALRPGATDTARGHLWYDGDEFVAWGENFLNPPDWREAGMLLEGVTETGRNVDMVIREGLTYCSIHKFGTASFKAQTQKPADPEAVALAVLAMLDAQD